MLLLAGTLNIWRHLRTRLWAQKAIQGANAAVVGVLGVALVQMASSGSVGGIFDGFLFALFFLILRRKIIPVWALVILAALGGGLMMH